MSSRAMMLKTHKQKNRTCPKRKTSKIQRRKVKESRESQASWLYQQMTHRQTKHKTVTRQTKRRKRPRNQTLKYSHRCLHVDPFSKNLYQGAFSR